MAFDMRQVQQGARNRRTPYHEATQRHDPKGFTVYNHMYFPIRYDTFEAEFDALLNGVTLWDVSVERCLEISGPDGFAFAQLLTPRDLSKCAVGQAKYVMICDADGGIINDPVLTRMDENTFWLALASSDALLFARGLKNAYPDLHVTIREADVAPLQVQGPKSKELMVDLVGPEILELKYYWWTRAKIAGIPVVITRTGWSAEVGYEIYLTDTSRGVELWDHIMDVGEPHGLVPTGPSDIRRIEGGIFNWGADMTYENNPLELGLDRLVSWDLDDQAAISLAALRRIRAEGIRRRIVGVTFDGDPFPNLNAVTWPVYDAGAATSDAPTLGPSVAAGSGDSGTVAGAVIGTVTSAIYSPRLEKNIGYAWLPVEAAEPGTTVRVDTEWGARTATVVEMPFVDPEKRIPVS